VSILHPQLRIRELLACLLLLGVFSVSLQGKESAQTNTLVITNVTVIDGTGAAPLSNVTVVIRNGRITGIAKIGFIERNRYVHIVNGAGKYIIPGLWNMHMHLVQDVEPPYTKEILLPLLVANGITGVRDMGGNLDVLQSLRRDIQAGKLLGPRIVASGPMLDGPPAPYPDSMTIHNAEEGRAAVDMLKRKKSDFIKVQSLLSREAYFAIAEQARKRGITFVGHVPDDVTPAEASDAGQRSIEHFTNVLRACSPQEKQLMQAAEEFSKRQDPSPAEANDFGARQREQMVSTYDSARAAGLAAHFVSHSTWQVPTLVLLRYLQTSDESHWVTDARLKYVPVNLQRKWEQDRQAFLSGRSVENLAGWKIFFERNEELVRPFWLGGVRFLAGLTSFLVPACTRNWRCWCNLV
jgi:hypothetical protein